eukprot:753633-Hanusia_phi.AAC.2
MEKINTWRGVPATRVKTLRQPPPRSHLFVLNLIQSAQHSVVKSVKRKDAGESKESSHFKLSLRSHSSNQRVDAIVPNVVVSEIQLLEGYVL